MPKLCAFGCNPAGVSVHRFPSYEKFPERFKAWVSLCGGKLETVSDYEFFKKKIVCDRHFKSQDHNRNLRLNALAVPSLYLSETPACDSLPLSTDTQITHTPSYSSLHEPSTSGTAASGNFTFSSTHDIYNQPSLALSNQLSTTGDMPKGLEFARVLHEHNYTAASRHKQFIDKKPLRKLPTYYCAQVSNMHTKIKRLRSEVCRLRKKSKFTTRLENANKLSESVLFQQVVGRMAKPSQLFMSMQLQAGKKPKGRRFTIDEKVLALSLYKKSPKCYTLLYKYFTLPSIKAMKRLLGQIKLCPGINPIIFKKIKKSLADKDITDKLCSLII